MNAPTDLELVRAFYSAWNRGDLHGVLERFDQRGEFRPIFGMLFDAERYTGHAGITAWFTEVHESWAEYRLEPERLIEDGDRIVGIVHVVARRDGGAEYDARAAYIATVKDGRIVLFEGYDAEETLAALGVT
jgi:ketosteroid isomerase-like protein